MRATFDDPGRRRVEILGVAVSATDPTAVLERIAGWLDRREANYVCVNTVHSLLCAREDPRLREIYRRAGIVTPDGMPLVWISRWRGESAVRRVYGPDLLLACCETFRSRGIRHYFYGGAEGVAERLADRLQARFPGLKVAGTMSPPFRRLDADEREDIARRVEATKPDIIWVGLGCPKQDYWMADHVQRLAPAVQIGVGAAFDFHSGRKRQAPIWMRRSGLEWLFRLLSEPRRLAGRYLVGNTRFVALVLAEELRLRRVGA